MTPKCLSNVPQIFSNESKLILKGTPKGSNQYPKIDNTIGIGHKSCKLITYSFMGYTDVDIDAIVDNHKFSHG